MTRTLQSLVLLLACVCPAHPSLGGDWWQFLGPTRDGISTEKGLINDLDRAPTVVWRAPAGVGMSGVAIRDGRLVTMSQDARDQSIVCYDAKTGNRLWQTKVAPAYRNQQGDGPRATPAIVGDSLIAYTGQGVLVSVAASDGAVRWKKDLLAEFNAKPADYGMACSPLLVGDTVVVSIGAREATVAAFKVADGKLAWTAGRGDPAGYSSASKLQVAGAEQVVVFNGAAVLGVNPKTGEQVWRFPYRTDYECNTATPIAVKGNVLVSSGENHGSTLLQIDLSKSSATEVWSSYGAGSVLRSEWQTPILLGGYLYGFDNVGSAGPVTHLTCVEAATGKRAWQEIRFGKGNLTAADGKLFITTVKGDLVLVEASPSGFKELGRAKVSGFTRQAPVIANGLLYVRDEKEIICLDVRRK